MFEFSLFSTVEIPDKNGEVEAEFKFDDEDDDEFWSEEEEEEFAMLKAFSAAWADTAAIDDLLAEDRFVKLGDDDDDDDLFEPESAGGGSMCWYEGEEVVKSRAEASSVLEQVDWSKPVFVDTGGVNLETGICGEAQSTKFGWEEGEGEGEFEL